MNDVANYQGVLSRIDRLEHDIREIAQCIVFMCECVKDIHTRIEEA